MCGIALILSGVRIIGSDLQSEPLGASPSAAEEVYEAFLPIHDLKAALLRRGPDNLGIRKFFIQLKWTNSIEKEDDEDKEKELCLRVRDNARDCIISAIEAASIQDFVGIIGRKSVAELYFLGATLQLRGLSPVFQPLVDPSRNLLVYNGEIFGGVHVAGANNDAEALLHALERCCSCDCLGLEKACCRIGNEDKHVPEILSTIRGPWALIYWQEKSKTIWFGRDAFGRRSLLVHWPTYDDSRFVLSSVSPPSITRDSGPTPTINGFEHGAVSVVTDMACEYWEELPCGIYSIHLKVSEVSEQFIKESLFGEFRKHEWPDPLLNKLIKWERTFLDPKVEEFSLHGLQQQKELLPLPSNFSDGTQSDLGDLGVF